MTLDLDAMTQAYLDAVVFTEETRPNSGVGVTPALRDQARRDVEKFVALPGVADRIAGREDDAGHDLWLTRNRHGAGFWDGDWPEADGKFLTRAADVLGETWVYPGENGDIDV